jgi:endonuclease/exonuclease/phosphatase family metal-dependent hydrolase
MSGRLALAVAGLLALQGCLGDLFDDEPPSCARDVPTSSAAAAPAAASQATGAGSRARLTVLQWNIHNARRTDGVSDPDLVARWIARLDPDVVALNEVGADLAESLPDRLRAHTGEAWQAACAPENPGNVRGHQVQVLSRWPIEARLARHAHVEGASPRVFLGATVGAPGAPSTRVTILATHLDNRSERVRRAQAELLTRWAADLPLPQILAGDLNATPRAAEVAVVAARYRDAWAEAVAAGTATAYPENRGGRTRRGRIDYVFFDRTGALALAGAQVPDVREPESSCEQVVDRLDAEHDACRSVFPEDRRVRPSDHNPVLATFDLERSGR